MVIGEGLGCEETSNYEDNCSMEVISQKCSLDAADKRVDSHSNWQ